MFVLVGLNLICAETQAGRTGTFLVLYEWTARLILQKHFEENLMLR